MTTAISALAPGAGEAVAPLFKPGTCASTPTRARNMEMAPGGNGDPHADTMGTERSGEARAVSPPTSSPPAAWGGGTSCSGAPSCPKEKEEHKLIGYRASYVDEEIWKHQKAELDESPFLLERPTLEDLLATRLASGRNIPRMLQPWQVVMRNGYRGPPEGRYKDHLAFLMDQDKAFKELVRALKAPTRKAPTTSCSSSSNSTKASVKKQQELVEKASRPISTKGRPRKPPTRAPEPAPAPAPATSPVGAKEPPVRPLKRPLQEVQLPRVEVKADSEVWVDGTPLGANTRVYARVFGLAYAEKLQQGWKIGPGVVDRCYYKGVKSQAKANGDYIPTDAALVADYVRRRPDALREVDKL